MTITVTHIWNNIKMTNNKKSYGSRYYISAFLAENSLKWEYQTTSSPEFLVSEKLVM